MSLHTNTLWPRQSHLGGRYVPLPGALNRVRSAGRRPTVLHAVHRFRDGYLILSRTPQDSCTYKYIYIYDFRPQRLLVSPTTQSFTYSLIFSPPLRSSTHFSMALTMHLSLYEFLRFHSPSASYISILSFETRENQLALAIPERQQEQIVKRRKRGAKQYRTAECEICLCEKCLGRTISQPDFVALYWTIKIRGKLIRRRRKIENREGWETHKRGNRLPMRARVRNACLSYTIHVYILHGSVRLFLYGGRFNNSYNF